MDVVCQIRLEDQGSCKELFVGIASPLKTAKDYTTLFHGLCHRTFIDSVLFILQQRTAS